MYSKSLTRIDISCIMPKKKRKQPAKQCLSKISLSVNFNVKSFMITNPVRPSGITSTALIAKVVQDSLTKPEPIHF